MRRIKALSSWSSGKDAAWAPPRLRQAGAREGLGLLTTTHEAFEPDGFVFADPLPA